MRQVDETLKFLTKLKTRSFKDKIQILNKGILLEDKVKTYLN